jgi:hypothetical protein
LEDYQYCVLRATLERNGTAQFAEMKGREIEGLVKSASAVSCSVTLTKLKQLVPDFDWVEATSIIDATNIGLLATNAVQLVSPDVCRKRLRSHDKCL